MVSTALKGGLCNEELCSTTQSSVNCFVNVHSLVQSKAGTECVSSNSYFTNMCSLPCTRFQTEEKQSSLLSTEGNFTRVNVHMLASNLLNLICSVPIGIVQECTISGEKLFDFKTVQ